MAPEWGNGLDVYRKGDWYLLTIERKHDEHQDSHQGRTDEAAPTAAQRDGSLSDRSGAVLVMPSTATLNETRISTRRKGVTA